MTAVSATFTIKYIRGLHAFSIQVKLLLLNTSFFKARNVHYFSEIDNKKNAYPG
jgi:hypothetical protein